MQDVHDNEQKTTQKIEKQRTEKAMLRDNRKSLREEQSKRPPTLRPI